jgi:hypothetical protein
MWITNGHQADWICLLANTGQPAAEDGNRHGNKSLICVNMNEPGNFWGAFKRLKMSKKRVDKDKNNYIIIVYTQSYIPNSHFTNS